MSTRSRKDNRKYKRVQKTGDLNTDCVFCRIEKEKRDIVQETKFFMVIRNIYGYSSWDNQDVEDHLMIVPKKHTDTLSDLEASEAVEFVELMGAYESKGYSVWARAPQSIIKSVVHQHTHLIKAGRKKHKFVFYINKPYLRVIK